MTPSNHQSSSLKFHSTSNPVSVIALLLIWGITAVIYFPGLTDFFMFDDIAHVEKNGEIAITDLSLDNLRKAWNSSPFAFPHNRPVAQLSFGLNHVLAGMNAYWFKFTNFIIHLLAGGLVFLLVKQLLTVRSTIYNEQRDERSILLCAVATCALWLFHPLNLTPVLYVVQRMTGLAALFSLLAIWLYLRGRTKMIQRDNGFVFLVISFLICFFLAFSSKENTLLLPGLIFLVEWILLGFFTPQPKSRYLLVGFFSVILFIPATVAVVYLIGNTNWLTSGFNDRPFTFLEHALTETRVLWLYIQMLFTPDLAKLGFFHDDFALSKSIVEPVSTLLAVIGLIGLLGSALLLRKRAPVLAFGILFFFTGHALESSIFPLELVYEHRNYLPSFGPLFALGYYLSISIATAKIRNWMLLSLVAICAIFGFNTWERAKVWGSELDFYLTEVANHPESPRANFKVGSILISRYPIVSNQEAVYELARIHLEKVTKLNPRNSDGFFGLIILNLHAEKSIPEEWLNELRYRLEHTPFSPLNITTSQFSFLVKWHMSDGAKLTHGQITSIFDAVLRNSTIDKFGKAGIYNALRAYYQKVHPDPKNALEYAHKTFNTWPERAHYLDRLLRVLAEQGRADEAADHLRDYRKLYPQKLTTEQVEELESLVNAQELSQ